MILREMLANEYAEGNAESIILLLEVKGIVSEELKAQILAQHNNSVLDGWLKVVAKCASVEKFVRNM